MIPYVGELTPGDREWFDQGIIASYRNKLGRLWYETNKPYLRADAVRYIDNLLAQPG